MDHLSGIDANSLRTEAPEAPMHVGCLKVCALQPGYAGEFVAEVREHMAGRLRSSLLDRSRPLLETCIIEGLNSTLLACVPALSSLELCASGGAPLPVEVCVIGVPDEEARRRAGGAA